MNNLKLPNIAKAKLTPQVKSEAEFFITGRTPIGTISKVPTSNNQKKYLTKLIPLQDIQGIVTREVFESSLSIYENNQVYYQDRLEDGTMNIFSIKLALSHLEHWFAMILEPMDREDIDGWLSRESHKLINHITIFCDKNLLDHIDPISDSVINFIKISHHGIFT